MTENKEIYDSVIIGSGPAGLTAAIYQIRAGLRTVVISGNQPGGQLTITIIVENYPGFPTGIGGHKLMMDTMNQVKNLGGEIRQGVVKELRTDNQELKTFETELEDGTVLKSRAIIVTTGAKARWLELPNEKELIGKGVSGCATCDGFFFRDKTVAVIGGGDTACEDAEFLSRFTSKVYLIHRRDQLRASQAEQKKVLNNPKIEMIWNTEVKAIVTENSVEPLSESGITTDESSITTMTEVEQKLASIKIINNISNEEKTMNIDGLFVAIGHDPATSFLKGIAELKETGHIVTGSNNEFPTMTTFEGIFAAGDCVDDTYMQAIVAAGDGCRAALDAERWLQK